VLIFTENRMYLTDLESIKAREIGVKVCSIPSSKLLTADWLDRVLPFFEEQGVSLLRILTDRGSEYSGNREYHEYELYLQVEGIEHTKTRTKSPQTNGICEWFQRTILNGFYQVAFRTKVYGSIEDLRVDLDAWLSEYNEKRFSLVEILL